MPYYTKTKRQVGYFTVRIRARAKVWGNLLMKAKFLIVFLCLICLSGSTASASNVSDVFTYGFWERGYNEAKPYPAKLFQKEKFSEFTSYDSNWEIQGEFPQAWVNEYWDSDKWPKTWKSNATVLRLFEGDIFKRHYMKGGQVPVLEVGPVFYRLSSLDKERTIRLFAQQSDILNRGFDILELADWANHKIIGSFTKYGMFLY